MVVVEELHDVQEEEECLTQRTPCVVTLVPVSLSDGNGQSLEPLSVRVGRGGGGRNMAELLIQQFQYFAVILWEDSLFKASVIIPIYTCEWFK